MHTVVKRLVLSSAFALCFAIPMGGRAHAQTAGLTVTPATLTLSLAKDATTKDGVVSIANQYAAPVTLQFTFERRIGQTSGADPSSYLHVSQTRLTIGAGEIVRQTVTLSDDKQLGPGSQLADLVITQVAVAGNSVSVVSSIRLPLILIKEAGAVAGLKLTTFSTPRTGWAVPHALDITLRNSGNVITIPHGFITITSPNGSVVSKGVLNTSSLAISPGGTLLLDTKLTSLGKAVWPGIYGVTVSYGLGGGQMASIASKHFFYVAWWHLLILAALGAGIYYLVRRLPVKSKKQQPLRRPPKRTVMIGRNA